MPAPTASTVLPRSMLRVACALCSEGHEAFDVAELTRVSVVNPDRREPRVSMLCPTHARAFAGWWYGQALLAQRAELELVDEWVEPLRDPERETEDDLDYRRGDEASS